MLEDFAPVEDVRRLHHRLVDALVVETLKGNVFLCVRSNKKEEGGIKNGMGTGWENFLSLAIVSISLVDKLVLRI